MPDPHIQIRFDEDIVVSYLRRGDRLDVGSDHYHTFYELYFYLGNDMTYFIADQTYPVQGRDLILIDQFLIHRTIYRPEQWRDRILVLFSPAIIEGIEDQALVEAICGLFKRRQLRLGDGNPASQRIEDGFFRLVETGREAMQFRDAKLRVQLLDLLITLLEVEDQAEHVDRSSVDSPRAQKIREALAYINAHYREDLSLDRIAEQLFISKYYLSRIFNEDMEIGVLAYVNVKRLSEAERLLRYSNHSVLRISEAVGFGSSSHFIHLFKQRYGVTPRVFREMANAQNEPVPS